MLGKPSPPLWRLERRPSATSPGSCFAGIRGTQSSASGHVRDGAIAERHHTRQRGVVGPRTGDPDRRTLDIVSTPRVCETVDRGAGMTFFFKLLRRVSAGFASAEKPWKMRSITSTTSSTQRIGNRSPKRNFRMKCNSGKSHLVCRRATSHTSIDSAGGASYLSETILSA